MSSPREQGFSLLELLVVIVIISILFTFTTLAIRGTSPQERIKEEALRLNQLIQLASEEAILRGVDYGIEFGENSYHFLVFEENEWNPVTTDKLLRERSLPEKMSFDLIIENTDIVIEKSRITTETEEKPKLKPQIYILSSGEFTPEFSVRLEMPGERASYIVSGKINGEHNAEASEL